MFKAKTRVIIKNNEDFFGPGTAAFFRQIQEMGSIRKATQAMGISYSKGWKLIKRVETELGYPVFTRKIGGKDGGSSQLTEKGLDFLKRYIALQKGVQEATDKLYSQYF